MSNIKMDGSFTLVFTDSATFIADKTQFNKNK